MIKNVLLINPPTGVYDRSDRCQAPIEEEGIEMIRPPMDLAYIAAMVEKAGKRAIIKDYPAEKKNLLHFKKDIQKIKPEVLILSVTTPTLNLDLEFCRLVKKINPKIITIAKGAHFYEFDKEVLRDYKDLDIAIRGEAEETVYEIVSGQKLNTILGISYRKGNKIFRNKDRPFLQNLDSLPFPSRHLINNNLYCFPDTEEPYALIMSGRGCPGNCIFCLVGKVSGARIRYRSVENIVEEIKECINRYNIRTFFFRADTFTWRKDWVLEFCKQLINKKIKIRWGTNSRVDTIDEEMIKKMKEAGCDVIGFGIESGSKKILEKMGKKISLEKSRKAVELCYKHNIKTLLFFIFGLPWEDRKTIEETIKFAKLLPGTFYNFSIAYPFPGTKFAEIAQENSLVEGNSLYGFDYANPVVKTLFLSSEELIYFRKKALRQIYFRPVYVLRILSKIKSSKELFNYIKTGFDKTRKLINISI